MLEALTMELRICLVIFALVACWFAFSPSFFRWRKYRALRKRAWASEPVEIDGLGLIHINPMPVALRMAMVTAINQNKYVKYDVYCWLISECVEEFLGRQDIGMTIPPTQIEKVGEEILRVSGLTKDSQEEEAKKSVSAQS